MIQSIDQSGVIHIFKGKQNVPVKLVIGEILTAEIMDIFPTGTIQIKINNRILNAQLQREMLLNKGDTVVVKVEKPLEDGTIPLRVFSSSETEKLQKFITKSEREFSEKILKLIESIFSQNTSSTEEIKQSQMDMIKTILTIPTENLSEAEKTVLLKKLLDVFFSRSNTAENLQELITLLKSDAFKEELSQLKKLIITNNEDLTAEKLKEALLNSGVSFEAKMKQALSDFARIEQIKEDLKVILNNIARQAKAEGMEEIVNKAQQILRQIEGYQVLSKTYQSFFTFLPLFWKEIEGGNIAYKSFRRHGKEYYTVFISIDFKEENLSFVVTMINKNFFISFSGKSELVSLIRRHETILRERFYECGMILSSVNYFSKTEELLRKWNIKEGSISLTV